MDGGISSSNGNDNDAIIMKRVGKRKSKRARKQPKCILCNPYRWLGNSKSRYRFSYYRQQKVHI